MVIKKRILDDSQILDVPKLHGGSFKSLKYKLRGEEIARIRKVCEAFKN